MNEDSKRHGAFGWSELMTTDVESARRFYTELFGWEIEEFPMEGANYTLLKVNGDPVGGIMAMPSEVEGMPPSWGTYVTVEDVDATARQAAKLGGTVLRPPTNIPNVGRFCVLQDAQGAVISAITYVDGSS